MATTPKLVYDEIYIVGALTPEVMEEHKKTFKSAIYMAPDTATDTGYPGGLVEYAKHFPEGMAVHVPMDCGCAPYNNAADTDPVLCVQRYGALERHLAALPRPLLISCKSGARASAGVAIYKFVQLGQDVEAVRAASIAAALPYIGRAGLERWVDTTVATMARRPVIFRQFSEPESNTYTYLVGCPDTKEAVLIDPVLETHERDAKAVREMGLTLKYTLNTHCHADHITGTWKLKTLFPDMRTIISAASGAQSDLQVKDGDKVVFGGRHLTVLSTPGHTDGCVSFLLDDCSKVFTGDAILIRGCGRTDFQQGNAGGLFDVCWSKLLSLNGACELYPAHDYKGWCSSSVAEERTLNPRLTKTRDQFIAIMDGLNLPYPKKIDASLPANLRCGCQD